MTAEKNPTEAGKETIYIDVEDDVTAIIDKVEASKGKLVALVLPKRATSLQSIVNMRLLAKSAENSDKKVVLVTAEAAILPLAGAARIPVAKTLTSAPEIPPVPGPLAEPSPVPPPPSADDEETYQTPAKIDYQKPIGELAGGRDGETIELGGEEEAPAVGAAAAAKKPKAPKSPLIKVPNFDQFRLWLGAAIAGGILLIVFIILAIWVWPKASVAITTTSTPVSATFNITTSGSAKSVSGTTVPGVSKTSDQNGSQTVSATGQQNNGDKATGTVTLTQDPCSGPITIAGGTGISSGGLTFITAKSVTLNAAGTDSQGYFYCNGNVGVTAQQGGSKYNLPASSKFSVYGYSSVSGSNSSAFTGGTDNIQTVVAQADVDGAKNQLTDTTGQNSFAQKFENQLASQGYYVFVSTLKLSDPQVTANPAVGQPASTTSVSVKVTYTVLAVLKSDLTKAITNATASQIDSSKQKLDPNGILSGATITVSNQSSPTDATLSVDESAAAVPIIDISSLKNQIKGQKSGQITNTISAIPGVQKVTVKLSPFWVSKAPGKTSHIIITTQHVGS